MIKAFNPNFITHHNLHSRNHLLEVDPWILFIIFLLTLFHKNLLNISNFILLSLLINFQILTL